jgi:hypothetical protein
MVDRLDKLGVKKLGLTIWGFEVGARAAVEPG